MNTIAVRSESLRTPAFFLLLFCSSMMRGVHGAYKPHSTPIPGTEFAHLVLADLAVKLSKRISNHRLVALAVEGVELGVRRAAQLVVCVLGPRRRSAILTKTSKLLRVA